MSKHKKPRGRGPVVHLDRIEKARMIESIISDFINGELISLRILDIGCGNGDISHYFSQKNDQYGVDVKDQRKSENKNFSFRQVDSELLPFENDFFDVVISHHVIEHVSDQGLHLSEIHRTLKPGGAAYIATPNKSSPIMEGHVGNDKVLKLREMAPLFEANGFKAHKYSSKLVKNPDKYHGEIKFAFWLPMFILELLSPLFPSQVFMLSKA